MGEWLAAFEAREVGEKDVELAIGLTGEAAAGVLREKDFWVTPERTFGGERFNGGHVEHGAAEDDTDASAKCLAMRIILLE